MKQRMPDPDTVDAAIALALAVRAPSVHNTQPWTWHHDGPRVELRADHDRRLRRTDPDGRDLMISCGCALQHFRVAAAALGWTARIARLPDPADPGLLATLTLVPRDVSDAAVMLAAAIAHRRSDRRTYTGAPLTEPEIAALGESVPATFGKLRLIRSGARRTALVTAAAKARGLHRADPAYRLELAAWTGRYVAADGVPARNATKGIPGPADLGSREFAEATLRDSADVAADGATLAVLATHGDTPLDRLHAGEAAGAALLTATRLGLASCLLSEPLELPATRGLIRDCVLDGATEPQLVLRVGRLPAGAEPPPATPRRTVGDVRPPHLHGFGAGLPIPAELRHW